MRISAGRLDRKVVFLAPTATKDASGGPVTAYAETFTRMATRLKFAPTEDEREPQRQTVAAINLLVRLDTKTRDVTTEWRVRFDGQDLEISGLEATPRDGSLQITGTVPQE